MLKCRLMFADSQVYRRRARRVFSTPSKACARRGKCESMTNSWSPCSSSGTVSWTAHLVMSALVTRKSSASSRMPHMATRCYRSLERQEASEHVLFVDNRAALSCLISGRAKGVASYSLRRLLELDENHDLDFWFELVPRRATQLMLLRDVT